MAEKTAKITELKATNANMSIQQHLLAVVADIFPDKAFVVLVCPRTAAAALLSTLELSVANDLLLILSE